MAIKWIENLEDPDLAGPLVLPGAFQAGATAAVAADRLLERTADTNTKWIEADSDHDASTTKLAVSLHAIASGDLAGNYGIIIPRPGDVFEADLAAASALAPETALYWSDSATLTVTAGTNIIGYSVPGPNMPKLQHRLSQGQLGDNGTTNLSTNKVRFVFRTAYSAYSLYQRA